MSKYPAFCSAKPWRCVRCGHLIPADVPHSCFDSGLGWCIIGIDVSGNKDQRNTDYQPNMVAAIQQAQVEINRIMERLKDQMDEPEQK